MVTAYMIRLKLLYEKLFYWNDGAMVEVNSTRNKSTGDSSYLRNRVVEWLY